MVLVRLLEADDLKTVAFENGFMAHLPEKVSIIEIFGPSGDEFNDNNDNDVDLEYEDLTKMLRGLSRKLQSITLHGYMSGIPNDLALLICASQTTDKLVMRYDVENADTDFGFGCLMSCVLQQDGLKALHLNLDDISTHQAKILFEGVAKSSCLETLKLELLTFEDDEAATDIFVDALKQNRSLKVLDVEVVQFTQLEEIFRAAILNTKVRSIRILDGMGVRNSLDLGFALDVLSSQGCQLQSIYLALLDTRVEDWDDNVTRINTTVNEVNFGSLRLDNSHLKGISTTFKSMKKLQLYNENLNDLSHLDPLLIGVGLKLQHLDLNRCKIDENCIIDFFGKLPQMIYIRRIDLLNNPFLDSHEWMDVLSNAVRRNASLECMTFAFREEPSVERRVFYSNVEVALALNRAWRRYMENGPAENNAKAAALPSNLWPLVLERATKISYFACVERNTPVTLQTDVVFWLLRERMVGEIV